jgi:hypothetical protein
MEADLKKKGKTCFLALVDLQVKLKKEWKNTLIAGSMIIIFRSSLVRIISVIKLLNLTDSQQANKKA